ncbi:STAS domain-containing protein [Actinosynnema sp. NPDC047251]|uniref:Anti-sigma factor antagonist n=1 Tax=Saccharothrix espanaensis (strain ATCC 51144 / DSM 44229 / JCM 9112 / NBRC 15066 / NRRL 15764) TaxID=1179773 RepID=K0K4V6_SACES|nr:STAS domain-containing protein [Saccharothrix espanaensis]CCH32602.1 Anti-sigma F factor antagonist [Saccharothrix espanaensis DSM 44229]
MSDGTNPLPGMRVDVVDEVTVLRVAGEIDMSNSDPLRESGVKILDGAPAALVLDLVDVTFFASSGIAVLAHLRQHNADGPACVVRLAASRQVRHALRVTAMDELFPIHDSVEDALTAARQDTNR